jgi:RNA polymerase sigma-70 factor (ECF subfamily)
MEAARAIDALGAGAKLTREGVELLYRTLGPRVHAYLSRQVGDHAAASDLLQETFVRLLQSPPAAASDAELRAYVYRTAQSRAVDYFRRTERRSEVAPAAEPACSPAVASPDLERAFAQLEPRDRALLWLAYVEEMRHNEIARIVGVRTLSVKVLLYRARRRFEAVLRARGINPEIEP